MHQQLTMYKCPLPCQLCPDVIHCDSDKHQIDGDSEARGRASAQGRASVAKLELYVSVGVVLWLMISSLLL